MAIKLDAQYPGRIQPADANYAYGSAKNETTPGAGDGTPYELARANDIFGFQQALLRAASIVPSGNAETQLVSEYMQAIVELASGRAYNYDDSGIANTYILDLRTGQQGTAGYFDNMKAGFTPTNSNTAGSTVNVNGLGIKNIFHNGLALTGGELIASIPILLIYDLANDRFNILTDIIRPYTNMVGGNKTYIFDDESPLSSFFPVSVLTQGIWSSIGKIGSGASYEWVEMNVIPVNAIAILLRTNFVLSDDVIGGLYAANFFARKSGALNSISDTLRHTEREIHSSAVGAESVESSASHIIALNASNLFDVQWDMSGGVNVGLSINCEFVGFITN